MYLGRFALLIAPILINGILIEITHWNDISGQIESFVPGTSNSSSAPTPCPPGNNRCVGGVVNLVNHISKNVVTEPDVKRLRLSAGNLIGGESGWIPAWSSSGNVWSLYGGFILRHFKPDVMALGMKEFGSGVTRTVDFMKALGNNSVLANTCGANPSPEPEFCGTIRKIITLEGDLLGVVGFVTPNVERLSLPGKLVFSNVVESVKRVVEEYNGIKTFIAIGDGDLNLAKEIMDEIQEIKLVIYSAAFGNTNIGDTYPLAYKQGFIATAGRYGSSIGKLIVDWDRATGGISVDPRSALVPTVLTALGEEAQAANSEYGRDIRPAVEAEKANVIGQSGVTMDGSICWRQECTLGNLVTDAMVHCVLSNAPIGNPFPFPLHSIWHSGAFFEEGVQAGVVSKFDIHKWLPFHNRAHLVKAKGSDLLKVFEKSASGINPNKAGERDWGQFLQVSRGVEVYYSTESEAPELTAVRMTHDGGDGVPRMGDLDETQDYFLVIPTYLYEGRGVYGFVAENYFWSDYANSSVGFDDECVENYIRALGQISVGIEGRILMDRSPPSQ